MFIFLNIFHFIILKAFWFSWFMTKHALINVNYLNIVKYYQLNVFISGSELPFSFLHIGWSIEANTPMCSTHQEVFSLQN